MPSSEAPIAFAIMVGPSPCQSEGSYAVGHEEDGVVVDDHLPGAIGGHAIRGAALAAERLDLEHLPAEKRIHPRLHVLSQHGLLGPARCRPTAGRRMRRTG